jgi:6-phosphofructokinase
MSNVSIKMCPPCLRTPVHHVSGTYRERAGVRGMVSKRSTDLNAPYQIHNRLVLSGRWMTRDTSVSSLSHRERAGVRVAFDVRVGLDVGNAFSRMLSGDEYRMETP